MLTNMIIAIGGGLYLSGLAVVSATVLYHRNPSDVSWLKVIAWPAVIGAAVVNHIKGD